LQFQNISISRQLTQYDKEVFNAVANLRYQGNEYITTGQIYAAMGYANKITSDIKKKIINSITVMKGAEVTIDNTEESENYNYKRKTGSFYLLPVEFVKSEVNGRIVEDTIELIKLPALFEFALERKQIMTLPKNLLALPVSRTESALAAKNYLLHRIGRTKNGQKVKILLKTLHEKCEITTKLQKSRLKPTLESILNHFKSAGFIKDYSLTSDSIIISTPKEKKTLLTVLSE
jgi:hypothetical protein